MSQQCPKCGALLKDTATFCNKCGQRLGAIGTAGAPVPQSTPEPNAQPRVPRVLSPELAPSASQIRQESQESDYGYTEDEETEQDGTSAPASKKSSCCLFSCASITGICIVLAVIGIGFLLWWAPWNDEPPHDLPGLLPPTPTSRSTPKPKATKAQPPRTKPKQTAKPTKAAKAKPGKAERIAIEKGQKSFSASCGVEVSLGMYNSIKATEATVKPLAADRKSVPGGVRQAYSIDLQGYEKFDDLITISLPYDPSGTDPKNEKGSVLAEYKDKKTGEWVAIPHKVDTAKHEVIITTDHLSDYCVTTFTDSNTPYAKLSSLESYYIDDQTAVEVLQEFQQKDGERPQSASLTKQFYASLVLVGRSGIRAAAGMDKEDQLSNLDKDASALMSVSEDKYGLLNDTVGWLGDVANLTSSYKPIAELGSKVSDFTLGLSAASLCATVANLYRGEGDVRDAAGQAINLVFGRGGYYFSKYASGAMKIANIGVVFIDYSLDQFRKEADKTYKEAIFNALVYYNEQLKPRSEGEWYTLLYKAYKQTDGNKQRFSALLQHIFTAYSERFFDAPYQDQTICSREAGVRGYTSGEFYITEAAKAYCVKQYVARLGQSEMMQRVFERLCKRISYDCDIEMGKQLDSIRSSLNAPLVIKIAEDAQGSEHKYANGYAVLRSQHGRKAGCWKVRLDSSGCATVNGTVLGYIQAGIPSVLEVWTAKGNPDSDTPDASVSFKVSQKVTTIKVESNLSKKPSPLPSKKVSEPTAGKPAVKKSISYIYLIPKQMRKPSGERFGALYPLSSYLNEIKEREEKNLKDGEELHKNNLAKWHKSEGYKKIKERIRICEGKDREKLAKCFGWRCAIRYGGDGTNKGVLELKSCNNSYLFSGYGGYNCGWGCYMTSGTFDEGSMTFTGKGTCYDAPREGHRLSKGVREREVSVHISPSGATYGDRSFDVFVDPKGKTQIFK
ncbi:zinc ribbon domain-containing protein [bacterium]|nr:zinc ribbon domain-containing protein [bacterium]